LFGLAQSLLDQLHIAARGLPPGLRILLEGVKDINSARIPQGVYGAECITAMVVDDFHDACSSKAAQDLRILVLAAPLRDVQRISNRSCTLAENSLGSLRLVPTHVTGFRESSSGTAVAIIVKSLYDVNRGS
jgi:hypothetical protein